MLINKYDLIKCKKHKVNSIEYIEIKGKGKVQIHWVKCLKVLIRGAILLLMVGCRDAHACLGQGGKASSEGTSMQGC